SCMRRLPFHPEDGIGPKSITWTPAMAKHNCRDSNVAKLASTQYLAVYTLLQEDCYDTDDASAREIYPILVPESTLCTVQSSRRRQHRPSVVDRNAQAYRTAAMYGMRSGVIGTGGHLDGLQQAPRRHAYTAGEMSAMGRL